MGPNKELKQIIQIKQKILKNPSWPEANSLAILSVTEVLNSRGYSETNPGGGQTGTRARDNWIASPTS